jgi:4'-phosphopantetheinyl transferase
VYAASDTEDSPVNPPQTDEVDLFGVRLVATDEEVQCLQCTLAVDEIQRMNRFRFERHRKLFVLARGLLRTILASYIQLPADRITFQYGPRGKPTLCPEFQADIDFNLAHSEDCVLYAFTRHCELGVDLELVRQMPEATSIAKQFFAESEYADLLSVAPEKQARAFYNCWTRKEAYVKANGQGLSVPLNRFRVSLLPEQPSAFLDLEGDEFPISQWTLLHLDSFEGYVGALAIPSRRCTLRERRFAKVSDCLTLLNANPI